ncbi:hypothetical protein YB2330_002701 [Saitoella coloradoensis]
MTESPSITAQQYIEEQARLEAEARELMPYNFDNCSIVPLRQPIFACKTCDPIAPHTQRGACCYACSIQCHGDHELIELFAKREFTCDCGTDTMGAKACKLRKERSKVNEKNKYNHNFEGRFCFCDEVYNPEEEEGTMIQCLLCEDWYHEKCLGEVPDADDFEHMICRGCVDEHPWLKRYHTQEGTVLPGKEKVVDVEGDSDEVKQETQEKEEVKEEKTEVAEESVASKNGKRKAPSEDEDVPASAEIKKVKTENNANTTCIYEGLPPAPSEPISLFLTDNFRAHFCHCPSCISRTLSSHPVLLTPEETYEPPLDADSDTDSMYDAGAKALGKMDRGTALDGLLAYGKMKNALTEFLSPFAREGKVVTEGDVRAFMNKLKK